MTRLWDPFLTDTDQSVYGASGYGRQQELGTRPAVVVIDVTYGFIGHERAPVEESVKLWRNSCGEAGWDALPVIADLLGTARDKRLPVFFSTGTTPRPDRFDRGAWDYKSSRATATDLPAELAPLSNRIPDEIAPLDHEFVIAKYKPSVFFGTTLLSFLVDLKVDTLLLCGTTTSGCVRGTVLDAFNHNFHIAVVEEGTFDRFESSHALSLFDINAKYADVLPIASVQQYLGGVATGLYDDQLSFGS